MASLAELTQNSKAEMPLTTILVNCSVKQSLTVSGQSLVCHPPQREILNITRGRSDELFVPTNSLSQRSLRPDEFFVPTKFVPTNYLSRRMLRPNELCVPTNYVFTRRKGSSGRTPCQFDYFVLRGVTYYRLALD